MIKQLYSHEGEILEGWHHEDDLPDLDFTRDMLISVINSIYETGDVDQMEDCLQEVCAAFKVKFPVNAPKLRRE